MSKIVIIGSSPAVVKLIEELRSGSFDSEIMLILPEKQYPTFKDSNRKFIAKEIPISQAFCRPQSFYKQHKVDVKTEMTITRINFKRKRIFTLEKEQIEYDTLIVTDPIIYKFPEIKGTNREGCYTLKRFKDLAQAVEIMSIIDTVVIESDCFGGLDWGLGFSAQNKEVVLIIKQNSLFAHLFNEEGSDWIKNKFEEKNIRILLNNEIVEVLGDKEAKAVKLKSGKVIAADFILFGNAQSDMKFFDGILNIGEDRLIVNDRLRVEGEDVYALGCLSLDTQNVKAKNRTVVLEQQAKVVADSLQGNEYYPVYPMIENEFEIEGLRIVVLGDIQISNEIEVKVQHDAEKMILKKFFISNGILIGAILVNAIDEESKMKEIIQKKQNICDESCLISKDNPLNDDKRVESVNFCSEEIEKPTDSVEASFE